RLPAVERRAAALLRSAVGGVRSAADSSRAWRVVMLTDIVGSTQVSVERGDETYVRLVDRHHDLVRRCLAASGGVEFGDTGDGLWAWFADLDDALTCAEAIKDSLILEPAPDLPLDVKIVLVGGEPHIHAGKPAGLLLNLAARVMGIATAGDVLVN